jgi:DNA repair ATPase RecN
VLSQVGSYGKQIGQIIDVLNILASRLPKERLTAQERETLQDFHALSKQVDSAVTAVKGPKSKGITLSDIDQLVDQLADLEHSDQSAYRLLVEHIQQAISVVDSKANKDAIR